MNKYLIPILSLLLLMCERPERVWDNPNDSITTLDPSEWAPSNLQTQAIDDSQLKLTWTQEYDRISGFRIGRKSGSLSFAQIAEVGKDVIQYTDTGLIFGTSYTYRVSAFTDNNESEYITSTGTSTIFPPPSGLTATPVSDSEIGLTWTDNCSFESGYRIERIGGGNYTQIAEVGQNARNYTDTGLTVGPNYTYRVKAFTAVNVSDYATSTATNTSFPYPTNLIATAIDDQSIQLTWSHNCSFEDGYIMERSEDGAAFTQIEELGENVIEYTDTGLNYGTDYTFRVKAFTDENETGYATSTMTNTIFPDPSNLMATPIDDQSIQLIWTDNCSFEDGYIMERSEDGVSFTQITELGENVTEYTDTGLNYGTDYTFRVKAFTDENETGYATSTMTNTIFPDPSNLIATPIDDQSIQLIWTDNCSFEDGYKLERSEDGATFTQIAELGANITEYTDTDLNLGTDYTYTYRVKAFTDENESGYATSNTTNTSFPAPTNLTATAIDDQSIQLTWSHNCSFEDGYKLERSEDGATFTQIAELGANITEYTDTGLNYGTDYTYRVKAFTDENESGYATSNTTNTSFPAPTNLTATALNDSEIQLTWSDNCSFEDGYKLERSEDGATFTQIAELGANITEYTDTGLNYGTDYTYRVKAFTDENESGYATSNTTNTSFPAPTNLTATPLNDSEIQLTWSDNCSFEDGYKLERSEDGVTFTQIAELGANITEYTDTDLNYGTDYTYTYRVKAFTTLNESGHIETTVDFWQDCDGEWGGSAVEDCAGECNGTAVEDCNGECNGTAVEDCNGDCDGTAFENACDYCVGGNTGLHENYCGTVTDIDGNVYETVAIGNQVWMAENLKVTHYRNGDELLTGLSHNEWAQSDLETGAYAVYDDNESNASTYGYLYNWYAVDDSRNIAPEGWHVASDEEWYTLTDYLGGDAGSQLAGNADLWNDGDLVNNSEFGTSGFTAVPGGYRLDVDWVWGYYDMGNFCVFWTSTATTYNAWYRILRYYETGVYRNYTIRVAGFSVRCIRD
jgi:uncharacterized protein (TIGR02145 family)